MQNALIIALNNVYETASSIRNGKHKSFLPFMTYCRIVCDMIQLHIKGKWYPPPNPLKLTDARRRSLLPGTHSGNERQGQY